jgi:hypothetical protein
MERVSEGLGRREPAPSLEKKQWRLKSGAPLPDSHSHRRRVARPPRRGRKDDDVMIVFIGAGFDATGYVG